MHRTGKSTRFSVARAAQRALECPGADMPKLFLNSPRVHLNRSRPIAHG
jgi:hypothetical protein